MISNVAASGEQPDLAWDFVQKNFDALLARKGPAFRDQFKPGSRWLDLGFRLAAGQELEPAEPLGAERRPEMHL